MANTYIPSDPGKIPETDKAKLIALYSRLCPAELVTVDDPRRDTIAADGQNCQSAR
jgi:hypothetical protein